LRFALVKWNRLPAPSTMTWRRSGSGRTRQLRRHRRAPRINSYEAGPALACVCATISRRHPVLYVKPTRNWERRTRDAATDVKKNLATERLIYNSRVSVYVNRRGLRRISLRAEECPSSARKGSGNASDWTRPRGRHGASKTPHCIGAGWLLLPHQRYLCVRSWKLQV